MGTHEQRQHEGRQRRGRGLVQIAVLAGIVAGILGFSSQPAQAHDFFVFERDACGAKIAKTTRTLTPTYWDCTFVDDFTTVGLDTTKWMPQRTKISNYTLGGECQVDTPANIGFVDNPTVSRTSNDYLWLTARREAAPFTCQGQGTKAWTTEHTGATVMTHTKFSQAYGRFEVRAAVPQNVSTQGAQFSFWLYRQDLQPAGEIDPMEWYSKYPGQGVPMLHGATGQFTAQDCFFDSSTGPWHTYTLEWTPRSIRVLYDGEVCLQNTNWSSTMPAPFDTPTMINLTIGLDPKHKDTTGSLPSEWSALIDYVKVWQ